MHMKNYLCRGKTLPIDEYDESMWTVGYYVCFNGVEHRIYSGYAETDCGDYYPDWDGVIPKTVGRYTEMEDKHHERIFEGDIIYRDWFGGRTYQVTYDNIFGAFIGVAANGTFTTFDGDSDSFEIIGNIHDNPELMGN